MSAAPVGELGGICSIGLRLNRNGMGVVVLEPAS